MTFIGKRGNNNVPECFSLRSISPYRQSMGSPRDTAPAALSQAVVGIGVALWASDFDGPSRTRVEHSALPSFGAPRLLVHLGC